MTLLELSIVILVLLAFLSMLFIGVRAWKRGADRAACIVNIRQVQLSVRALANTNRLEVGDFMTDLGSAETPGAAIIGPGSFLENYPECPSDGIYAMTGNTVPPVGDLYMTCSLEVSQLHVPEIHESW